jgi:hypothetical protein
LIERHATWEQILSARVQREMARTGHRSMARRTPSWRRVGTVLSASRKVA